MLTETPPSPTANGHVETQGAAPLCACGCGLPVTKPGNHYLLGHVARNAKAGEGPGTAHNPEGLSIEEARAVYGPGSMASERYARAWERWAVAYLERHGLPADYGDLCFLLRSRSGRTRGSVSLELHGDPSYLCRVESGERKPTPEYCGRLSSALNLSPLERDALLVAAGHAPTALQNVGWHPALVELVALLTERGPQAPAQQQSLTHRIAALRRGQGTGHTLKPEAPVRIPNGSGAVASHWGALATTPNGRTHDG